jgi:hypothetical protein
MRKTAEMKRRSAAAKKAWETRRRRRAWAVPRDVQPVTMDEARRYAIEIVCAVAVRPHETDVVVTDAHRVAGWLMANGRGTWEMMFRACDGATDVDDLLAKADAYVAYLKEGA